MIRAQVPWQRYRRRPVMVDAFRWWGEPVEGFERIAAADDEATERHCLVIPTLEGIMRADEGDWIIRGVAGEFYPCKDGIFRLIYESAGD